MKRLKRAAPVRSLAGLNGFTDIEPISAGASSQVFRARQVDFDRVVAIKVSHVTLSDRRTRERFARELAVTGRLDGLSSIVVVHDRGITPTDHPFLVMAWYDGGSLADKIAAEGPLPVAWVLSTGVKLAAALAQAHRRDVVHRDIKPANVLLSGEGQPVLADFGVAVLSTAQTAATTAMTPVHAAPEQFSGGTADERSDIWSLGSTLFTALAGAPPFAGSGSSDPALLPMLLRLANDPLPAFLRRDVPRSLRAVIERAMAKRAEDRYASADALAADLQAVQAELGLHVTEVVGTAVPRVDAPAPHDDPLGSLVRALRSPPRPTGRLRACCAGGRRAGWPR